jgi:hypothetical protein
LDCGAEIDSDDKFYGNCGHDLVLISSVAEKLEKLKRFLPKDFTEKILARRDKIEGEPQRAVRSACAVHREISRFNNQIKQSRPVYRRSLCVSASTEDL